MVLTLQYGFTWYEICSWRLKTELLLMFPSLWSRVFGPSFSKVAIITKCQKTGRTQPCDGFKNLSKDLFKGESQSWRFWITFHLSQLRLPVFPKLPYCTKYPRTDEISPSDSLIPGLRLHLIWHIELRISDYFACVPAFDLWYFDLVSPNCAMSQIP